MMATVDHVSECSLDGLSQARLMGSQTNRIELVVM